MNPKILQTIEKLVYDSISEYLPEMSMEDFEENGTIYYMNDKNGTEFDWYVNGKLSDFFVYYNDEENLGAVKLNLYCDGTVILYIYDAHGHNLKEEVSSKVDFPEEEIMKLAVLLKYTMDDNGIWGADIHRVDTEFVLTKALQDEFLEHKELYQEMIERKQLLRKNCYVSKKLLEEGWKVGYMSRAEAEYEMDSGWCFMAGNEEDEYINNYHNIALLRVGDICRIDPDVMKYLHCPVGAEFVRVSSDGFEEDSHDKPVFYEKRR